jgi:hypothetical protein
MYAHRSPTSRAGTTESAVAVVGLEEERICHDARWVISVGGAGAGLGMGEGSQQPDRRAVKSRRSRCRGVKALVMYLALCYLWAFTGLLSPCAEDAKTVEEEEKKNSIAYGWLRDSHVSRLRSRPTRMCFPDTRSFNQGATSPSLGYAMLCYAMLCYAYATKKQKKATRTVLARISSDLEISSSLRDPSATHTPGMHGETTPTPWTAWRTRRRSP